MAHLKTHDYPVAIFPANPRYEEIGGCKAYPSLKSLPRTPDLALILVDAACLRAEVTAIAREHGIGVVGPNGQGMMNVDGNVYASFGYPILAGARGKPPVDVDALAEVIVEITCAPRP